MSLNIKNPHTHQLVRELAAALQVSQTEAVTLAVQERLRQENEAAGGRLATIRGTARQIRAHVNEPASTQDGGLYDEEGLFA